jgi:iron complex outermembrane recepter protein
MKHIFSTILLSILGYAQAQTAHIQGQILDQSGQKVPFVSIQLKELKLGTQSDENGKFEFLNLSDGVFTLKASYIAYKTLQEKITLEAGKTLQLTLLLSENTETLKEIIIQGRQTINEKPISIGKIAIKPMDLPQSLISIDNTVLKNQQVSSMADILMNTNGVYVMGTTGGYQEEISGRGFAFGSSNTFKNGVRYFNGMMTEMSGIERVEVLKGSTAILFGNVAAGGILNIITKKPKFDFGGEIQIKSGSFGLIKPSFDVYGGIGKAEKVAFRLNGSLEKANSFRVGVSSERQYINPSLLFKLNARTDILVEADYLKDERTPDFGAGIVNYKFVDIPRERFLGIAWSKFNAEQFSSTANLTHRFSEKWQLNALAGYRQYNTDLISNTRPNRGVLISSDGTWIRNVQQERIAEPYYIAQLDLKGDFKTAKLSHQVLIGMDGDFYKTNSLIFTPLARYDTINIFGTKTYKIRSDVPSLNPATQSIIPTQRVGVYAQDLIGIGTKVKFLAGLRYSYQNATSEVFTFASKVITKTNNKDGAFSPRLGIVYQPSVNHSLFGSYANSFNLNTGIDIKGNALLPSIVNQYELGIKNEFFNRKVSVNMTIYRITNSNLAQISLENGNSNANIRELSGGVQSDGVEIDINSQPIKNLQIMAGYSLNETKYISSNTFIEGSLLRYNPRHTANMSISYVLQSGLLKGFTSSLIAAHIGERYAGRSTRVQVADDAYRIIAIPSYTQVDASISYSFKNINIRTKIGNILDSKSFNVHDDNSVNPITPRNYSMVLGWGF